MMWILLVGCVSEPVETDTDEGIGTPTPEPATPPPEPTWEGGIEAMFTARCGPCHTGYDFGDLRLDDPDLFVGVPSSIGMAIVEPGSVEQSYLWHKVVDTHLEVGGTGDVMPLDVAPLDAHERRLLRDWIEAAVP